VSEPRARQPGMMTLIALAITVAFVASAATVLGLLGLEFWWELAGLIVIMLLGHWLEMRAVGQARDALQVLAELLPDEAERVRDGAVETVPVSALIAGDVVLVRPGARVPADGEVVDGAADMDESMITGESQPVARGEGDRVVAGMVATDSALRVRVDRVGEHAVLAGIQRLTPVRTAIVTCWRARPCRLQRLAKEMAGTRPARDTRLDLQTMRASWQGIAAIAFDSALPIRVMEASITPIVRCQRVPFRVDAPGRTPT
jgi:cation transport ATPase